MIRLFRKLEMDGDEPKTGEGVGRVDSRIPHPLLNGHGVQNADAGSDRDQN
jgi:hypothetical protein